MKPLNHNLGKILTCVGLTGLFTAHAFATPDTSALNYNLIEFSATASKKISNDEINASLEKTIQNKSSSEVAKQITETLNQAIVIAKKYPNVQVTTGSQSTYPQYKNQKIVGWTGSASLNIKSTDTVQASQLIADLQSESFGMQLQDLNFSVSDSTSKAVKQELMIEASKAFQQQAKTLLPVWQASSYQLVNLSFNQNGDSHYYRQAMPMMSMAVSAESASVPSQDFQAGESTLSVTANGTIQLVK